MIFTYNNRMKNAWIIIILTMLLQPLVEARGLGQRGGQGSGRAARSIPQRSSKNAVARPSQQVRNPMTSSRPVRRNKSMNRPSSRPSVTTPSVKPAPRPSVKPSVKPRNKAVNRPAAKPITRPSVKPGDYKYSKPSIGIDGKPLKPDSGARPSFADKAKVADRARPAVRPSIGKPIAKPPISKRPSIGKPSRPNWSDRPGLGTRPGGGNIINIGNNVDINFSRNVNWSVNSRYWGGRPWWGVGGYFPWHHGHWHYGWNRYPYYYRPGRVIAWGLIGWGLGNLIFNSGYHSYYNPYPSQTVVVYNDSGSSHVDYSQPVTQSADAALDQREGISSDESNTLAKKAADAFDEARVAFKQKDYVSALSKTNTAISYDPSETVQHEFRSLCLFALQKYSESASVLHSLLSSTPGWGWETMIDQYDSLNTYESQLGALEMYSKKQAKSAEAQFLLGYHFMTAGHFDQAAAAYQKVVDLQPKDQVAAQLLSLTANSTDGEGKQKVEGQSRREYNPPELDSLHGKWVSKTSTGVISLSISKDNSFTWVFDDGKKPFKMKGKASMDEGLLVLSNDESQMVAAIEMKDEKALNFVIAGGTEGDQGITFTKS